MRRSPFLTTMRSAGRNMPAAAGELKESARAPNAASASRSTGINDLRLIWRRIIAPRGGNGRSVADQSNRFTVSGRGLGYEAVTPAGLELDREREARDRLRFAHAAVH